MGNTLTYIKYVTYDTVALILLEIGFKVVERV